MAEDPIPTVSSEGRYAWLAAAVLAGDSATGAPGGAPSARHPDASAVARVVSLVAPLASDVLVVGADPALGVAAAARRVADPPGPACALRGVVGALAATRLPRVLILAADLPRLRPELLLALLAYPEADAVVPRAGGHAHPLCALYRREATLEAAQSRLASGDLSLQSLLESIGTAYLEGGDLEAIDPGAASLVRDPGSG